MEFTPDPFISTKLYYFVFLKHFNVFKVTTSTGSRPILPVFKAVL